MFAAGETDLYFLGPAGANVVKHFKTFGFNLRESKSLMLAIDQEIRQIQNELNSALAGGLKAKSEFQTLISRALEIADAMTKSLRISGRSFEFSTTYSKLVISKSLILESVSKLQVEMVARFASQRLEDL